MWQSSTAGNRHRVEREQEPGWLPNADTAFAEPAKLTHYLLDPDHPVGGDKAAFLIGFGFRREAWRALKAALLVHAQAGEVVSARQGRYGRHSTVEGPLATPDGRNAAIRTALVIAWAELRPRFVTAYPGRRSGGRQ
jgi:hypothetical protein